MLEYWNNDFKMPFLKYLNSQSRQSFNLPEQSFNWTSEYLRNSVNNFKLDLYDKFAIINIAPNYSSEDLIKLMEMYIKSVLPLAPDGTPYTFQKLIQEFYAFIIKSIREQDEQQNLSKGFKSSGRKKQTWS
jgi:hypothetical protein